MSHTQPASGLVQHFGGPGPKVTILCTLLSVGGVVGSAAIGRQQGKAAGEESGRQTIVNVLAPGSAPGATTPEDIAAIMRSLRTDIDQLRRVQAAPGGLDKQALDAMNARLASLEQRLSDLTEEVGKSNVALVARVATLEAQANDRPRDGTTDVGVTSGTTRQVAVPDTEAIVGTWDGQGKDGHAVSVQVKRTDNDSLTGLINWPDSGNTIFRFSIESITSLDELTEERRAAYVGLKGVRSPSTYYGFKALQRVQGGFDCVDERSWLRAWVDGDVMNMALFCGRDSAEPRWTYSTKRRGKK